MYLSEKCEALERCCGQLYDGQSDVFRTTRDLDDQLEKLETHSRRNNVRFFSVIEDPNEDYKACVHKVVELLNSFYRSKTWTSDDIERVNRVGPMRKNNTRSRTLIARLHRGSDKLLLLEEKENRKDMADKLDVRVAADLTDRQHGELRRQKEKGKLACYRNGRLCFREKQRSPRRDYPPWTGQERRQDGHPPHPAPHHQDGHPPHPAPDHQDVHPPLPAPTTKTGTHRTQTPDATQPGSLTTPLRRWTTCKTTRRRAGRQRSPTRGDRRSPFWNETTPHEPPPARVSSQPEITPRTTEKQVNSAISWPVTALGRNTSNLLKPKRDFTSSQVNSLLSTVNDSQAFWKEIRKHCGRKVVTNGISGTDWRDHFEKVLNEWCSAAAR